MGWLSLADMAIGLGVGALGGWFARRFLQRPAVAPPQLDPEPSSQLQQLRAACQMATELGQYKGRFLARTSHELRSPLNSVISLHQLILSDLCDSAAEEREFVAQAHTAAQKMLKLLDELIQIAKTEPGTLEPQFQPLSVQLTLMEVQRLTHLTVANRNLRLAIDAPNPDVYILADPYWLRQVLVHLVDRAVSRMDEGYIRLKVGSSDGKWVHLWLEVPVSDDRWQLSGEKLAEADLSMGLSLETDRSILELMNGELEILAISDTNSPSQTRIRLSLPQATLNEE